MELKCELYRDNFQNFKRYNIPKAQLVIADIPYNIGADAYGSNPMWYNGGDNQHIKIQYHNEELSIREICERLDDLQNKVNKYECEIRKYTESCDDCNFCKMED